MEEPTKKTPAKRIVLDSEIRRSYKYRFYPTPEQERTLESWQRICQRVSSELFYNRENLYTFFKKEEITKEVYNLGIKKLSGLITIWRAEYEFIRAVPFDTLDAMAKRIEKAYKSYFANIKAKATGKSIERPRAPKRSQDVGLWFRGGERGTVPHDLSNQPGYEDKRFRWWQISGAIKHLGLLKVRMHRPIPEGAEIRETMITRKVDGWHISFSLIMPRPEPLKPAKSDLVGVDLGCIHENENQRLAIVDDGRVYYIKDNLKLSQEQLAHQQKMVDSKRKVHENAKAADPNSKRTKKRRERIAKLHLKITRQREADQHHIANRLLALGDTVAVENINWSNLRRQGKPREPGDNRPGGRKSKKGLNRSMASASPGKLISLLTEKADIAGRQIVKVDARNTSQSCSACDTIGERKDLSVRSWECTSCGAKHDRDVNAAVNVKKRAQSVLNAQAAILPEAV